MKTLIRWGLVIYVMAALTGCTGNFPPFGPVAPGTAVPTALASQQMTSPVVPTQLMTVPAEEAVNPAGSNHLVVWLPPEFDPNSGTPAGDLLKSRLKEFEGLTPGTRIDVRVKAVTGPASLLDSLIAASSAAPRSLPDLVALSRQDLEVGALKGLLTPYDGLTKVLDDPDWFTFSRELTVIGGSNFGMPFAGDALLLLYRPSRLSGVPSDWSVILRQSVPLAFPAADPESLLTLIQYQAEGGPIQDNQGRPTLSADQLTRVLKNYETGAHQGIFPFWLSQYETDGQSWQAYRDQRAQMTITWVSRFLAEHPPDTAAVPLPGSKSGGLTLATGWEWALSNPKADQRVQSVKLAEFLVESDFLAKWTEAAGYLPTRPTALAAWTDQAQQSLLGPVAMSAQTRPSIDLLTSLGPVLKEATLQVVKGQEDPTQAAEAAAERFKSP